MIHEVLQVGPLRCNCSILGDEQTKQAIVVDPGDDISEIATNGETLRPLSNTEIDALWAYLRTLPPVASKKRA